MRSFVIFLVSLSLSFLIFNCEGVTDSNSTPSCSISSPNSNSEFIQGDRFTMNVNAEDEDGKVEEVRLYIDNQGIYTCKEFPYEYEINTIDIEPGYRTLKAVAYDDKNDKTSDSLTIHIHEPKPSEYNGLSETLYQNIFLEEFNNNDNGWSVGNYDGGTIEITNGYYEINNSVDSLSWLFGKEITNLDENSNFEIETEIKIMDDSSAGGLFWGLDNSGDYLKYYFYGIGGDDYYSIWDDYGSDYTLWFDWTKSNNVNNIGHDNKLTIRKYKDEYYFFINEIFLGEHPFKSFYDNKIGFYTFSSSRIKVDYLYVYRLEQTEQSIDKINKTKPEKIEIMNKSYNNGQNKFR